MGRQGPGKHKDFVAQLLAHLLVSMNACVEIVVPIGSNEVGYAKTYLGASEGRRRRQSMPGVAAIVPVRPACSNHAGMRPACSTRAGGASIATNAARCSGAS